MSIGTGTAIAIAAGVGAGASIYGANKQAGAAKTASQQQQAAAQQALAQTNPLYPQALQIAQQQAAQGQARLDPYAQQGGAGLTALSSFLGVPPPSAGASAAPSAALSPYAPTPAQQASAQAFAPTAVATSPNPAVRALAGPIQPGPYAAWPILQAPDGSQRRVPPDQADRLIAAGARRVR